MHTPDVFNETDRDAVFDHIERIRLGALIGPAGHVTHVPFILDRGRGGQGTLIGHMDAANPHARALADGGEALVAFVGPDAYVSPSWYATRPRVPTWLYVAVHARGRLRVIGDHDGLKSILERQCEVFEPADSGWRMAQVDGYVERLIGAIIGFEVEVTGLECQARLAQQNGAVDRARVLAQLQSGSLQDRRVAELMGREKGRG
ncbi:MAG: FMN-binding negative transcriptional regulator [Alphaproteobacteria bacterium]|nr:FMN-binding negative transcriptional regulator [Alphaproteobacteria bacterium]